MKLYSQGSGEEKPLWVNSRTMYLTLGKVCYTFLFSVYEYLCCFVEKTANEPNSRSRWSHGWLYSVSWLHSLTCPLQVGSSPGLPITKYPKRGNSSQALKVFGPRGLAFTQRSGLCWNVLCRQVLKNCQVKEVWDVSLL